MKTGSSNPYVGPRTFLKEEADLFFGREREARDLAALVASEKLVLFYAQSGAGKSSIINTRLIPDLEKKRYEVFPVGRVSGGDVGAGFETSNIYTYNLMRSLVQHEIAIDTFADLPLTQFLSRLNIDENGYFYDSSPSAEISEEEEYSAWQRVLIIDQFEEIFTTSLEAWKKRGDFFVQLAQAMEDDSYLWVILVMREDYIAALDPYSHLLPGGLRVRYYMQRLGRDAAVEAVEGPAAKQKRPFEAGVAQKLVDDLSSIKVQRSDELPQSQSDTQPGQYIEPVQLQVVCSRLWEKLPEKGKKITMENLGNVGDVNQSLGEYYAERVKNVAESVRTQKDGEGEHAIRKWFEEALIAPGGIRGMVLRVPGGKSGTLNDNIVQRFQGDLVRAEKRGGATWYELTHDRLVEPILENNREWFEIHSSLLQKQTALWVAQGRSDGLLLRGDELDRALQDAQAESKTMTENERDFLAACMRARDREKREKRANLLVRILAVGASIFFIIAISFGFWASSQARKATNALATATQALVTATYAQGNAESALVTATYAQGDAETALKLVEAEALAGQAQIALDNPNTIRLGRLLAVEAYRSNQDAKEDILPSVNQALLDSIANGNDLSISSRQFSSAVFNFETKENWLLVDNALWNLSALQKSELDLDPRYILQSSITSNQEVVSITRNTDYYSYGQIPYYANIININNNEKDQIPLVLPENTRFQNIGVSRDGLWAALVYSDSTTTNRTENQLAMLLWDLQNPQQEPEQFDISKYYPDFVKVAITQDGSKIAIVDDENLYMLQGENRVFSRIGDGLVGENFSGVGGQGFQFSADGRWLAMQTENALRLFDTNNQNTIVEIKPRASEEIVGYLFSPDSAYLVYVVRSNLNTMVMGRSLVSPAQKDSTIYMSTTADITALDISINNKVVIGDEAGYIRAWDITQDSQDPYLVTSKHTGAVSDILIGPDNQTIISSSEADGTRLWKLTESESDAIIENRISSTIARVVKNDSGDALAIGGINTEDGKGVVHLYADLQNPRDESETFISGTASSFDAMAISKDWIAAGRTYKKSYYGTPSYFLDFWKRDTAETDAPLVSFTLDSQVSSLAFDPTGSYLAVAANEGEIWIADTAALSKLMDSVAPSADEESSSESVQMPYIQAIPNKLTDIRTLFITKDSQYLVNANSSTVYVWDLHKLDEGFALLDGAASPIRISPDYKWLVTAGLDNTVQLFDLENITAISPVTIEESAATWFAFNQDSDLLAVANKTGEVSIYRIPITESSPSPIYTLQGPTGEVTWLEFSSDETKGEWVVAGSGYQAYLWNLMRLTDKPVVLQGYKGTVIYTNFTSDGEWIVTLAADQTMRFWSTNLDNVRTTACTYAGRNLVPTEWERYFPNGGVLRKTCSNFDLEQKRASAVAGPTPTLKPPPAFRPPPTATSTPAEIFEEYEVKSGDTLSYIALKVNVSMDIIIEDNNISNPALISVGQKLKIRKPNSSP